MKESSSSNQPRQLKAQLNWSLNISQTDDALYTLPSRSSSSSSNASSLSMAEDQWCLTPTYSLETLPDKQQQQSVWISSGRSMEATLFLSSMANHSIELICHDPHQQRTSSYQIEANSQVIQMQVLPLPCGVKKQPQQQRQDSSPTEAFGLVLVLATMEGGISAFSMVFTRTHQEQDSFALEECTELSNSELQDINTPLNGRQVRSLRSKIVMGPNSATSSDETASSGRKKESTYSQQQQPTKPYLIMAVASSPDPSASEFALRKSCLKSYNVDAFLFPLVDHQCPVFCYHKRGGRRRRKSQQLQDDNVPSLAHFQNVLKDVSRVKSLEFGGSNLMAKESHIFLAVLFRGELKLVVLPSYLGFQDSLYSQKVKVQTVLLAGVCAHPSVAGLGEATLLKAYQNDDDIDKKQDNHDCHIAVLCRPKLEEIGFQSSSPLDTEDIVLSATNRKTVSFSPVEFVNEVTPKEEHSKGGGGGFFQFNHPPKRKGEDWQTPKASELLDSSQIVTPESEPGDTKTPKKSNVSQISTASSLVGLKLIRDDSMASLAGLNFVSSRSLGDGGGLQEDTDDDSSPSEDIVDLTGKWSILPPREHNLSALSPLSGLNLDSSVDFNTKNEKEIITPRQSNTSMLVSQTPPNGQFSRNTFGPGSALKKIQCTTPAREVQQTKESMATSNDQLSHMIIIKVERTRFNNSEDTIDKDGMLLKVTHSSVTLPQSLSSFKAASVQWVAPTTGSDVPLIVAATINSVSSSDSPHLSLAVTPLSEGDGPKNSEMIAYDMTSLFQELERASTNDKERINGVRSIALVNRAGDDSSMQEERNSLALRLILSTDQVGPSEKDRRGARAPSTPINMSLTEDTRVTIASARLPKLLPSPPSKQGKEVKMSSESVKNESSSVQIEAKLDEVMSFLQRFEINVNTRMDAMDKRLGVLEEAMRTV